mmetsp:Transcript_9205/g.16071  ORF Transcript_9205/g.16071 Transcript_9205/m.16071 type:complete len:285 (+) Transcript_9205:427-1281(+)
MVSLDDKLQQTNHAMECFDSWNRDLDQMAQLDHDSNHGINLHLPAFLGVHQHGCLMMSDILRPFNTPLHGQAKVDAEFLSHLLRLGHDPLDSIQRLVKGRQIVEGGVTKCGHGIKRNAAPYFNPQLRADVLDNGRFKSSLDHDLRHALNSFGGLAVQLAQGKAYSFLMQNHPIFQLLRRGICNCTNNSFRCDAVKQFAIRIRGFDNVIRVLLTRLAFRPFGLAVLFPVVKVPPGNSVLQSHIDCVGMCDMWQIVHNIVELVFLEAQKDDVLFFWHLGNRFIEVC